MPQLLKSDDAADAAAGSGVGCALLERTAYPISAAAPATPANTPSTMTAVVASSPPGLAVHVANRPSESRQVSPSAG